MSKFRKMLALILVFAFALNMAIPVGAEAVTSNTAEKDEVGFFDILSIFKKKDDTDKSEMKDKEKQEDEQKTDEKTDSTKKDVKVTDKDKKECQPNERIIDTKAKPVMNDNAEALPVMTTDKEVEEFLQNNSSSQADDPFYRYIQTATANMRTNFNNNSTNNTNNTNNTTNNNTNNGTDTTTDRANQNTTNNQTAPSNQQNNTNPSNNTNPANNQNNKKQQNQVNNAKPTNNTNSNKTVNNEEMVDLLGVITNPLDVTIFQSVEGFLNRSKQISGAVSYEITKKPEKGTVFFIDEQQGHFRYSLMQNSDGEDKFDFNAKTADGKTISGTVTIKIGQMFSILEPPMLKLSGEHYPIAYDLDGNENGIYSDSFNMANTAKDTAKTSSKVSKYDKNGELIDKPAEAYAQQNGTQPVANQQNNTQQNANQQNGTQSTAGQQNNSQPGTNQQSGTQSTTNQQNGTQPTSGQQNNTQSATNQQNGTQSTSGQQSADATGGKSGIVSCIDMNNHWAEEYVSELAARGVMCGEKIGDEYYFFPERIITKNEFLLYMLAALDIGKEKDMTPSDIMTLKNIPSWFTDKALVGFDLGLFNGISKDEVVDFDPQAQLTRLDAIVMMSNAIKPNTKDVKVTAFADMYNVPSWAVEYVLGMQAAGLIQGYADNKIKVKEPVNRGMAAKMLCEAIKYCELNKGNYTNYRFDTDREQYRFYRDGITNTQNFRNNQNNQNNQNNRNNQTNNQQNNGVNNQNNAAPQNVNNNANPATNNTNTMQNTNNNAAPMNNNGGTNPANTTNMNNTTDTMNTTNTTAPVNAPATTNTPVTPVNTAPTNTVTPSMNPTTAPSTTTPGNM